MFLIFRYKILSWLGVQALLFCLFCDVALAARTVETVVEIQKILASAERRMSDEPEEAAKEIEVVKNLIEELKRLDANNPNIQVIQKKVDRLAADLKRWLRASARKESRY